MIPFASQRAGGADLATHLMNEHDNEYMELFEVRGAIARDLHGAFAEWEAQAAALTRCRQYLCSLSISPDEWQGRLTREQHLDYIERAEKKLGLSGQPRAIVFHIKEDRLGRMREHCHVVWSRIDARAGRAVQLSFFKEKLMTVTREFARDHGLELPEGYRRHEEKMRRRNRQLSAYDCVKQKETGITHEQRMAAVTVAWKCSDSGKAFAAALEDLGYVLARGRNGTRPVVVDIYGTSTALRRLIDDPAVRTKHVRELLGAEYAPENLPSVEQAQALAAQRRKAIEEFEKAREQSEQVIAQLKHQAARREKLEGEAARLRERQRQERAQLAAEHKIARQALKADYLAQTRRVRTERARNAPRGLAAFLGRITGVALITKKVQRYRDGKRFEAYLHSKQELAGRQRGQIEILARRHELQGADMQRKLDALRQVEKRELKALEQARTKERRRRINAGHEHMPAFTLELKPPGRRPRIEKAKNRFISPLARELAEAAQGRRAPKKIKLREEFTRVAKDESGEGETGGAAAAGTPPPAAEPKIEPRPVRTIDLPREFNAAAADPNTPPGGGGDGPSVKPPDPGPQNDGPDDRGPLRPHDDGPDDSDPPRPRPRRRRERDLDRGR